MSSQHRLLSNITNNTTSIATTTPKATDIVKCLTENDLNRIILVILKQGSFSVKEYSVFRLVSKLVHSTLDSIFWELNVRQRYFSPLNCIEFAVCTSNWKRCFFAMRRVFHLKDWSLCPMCCRESLGVLSDTKQLACKSLVCGQSVCWKTLEEEQRREACLEEEDLDDDLDMEDETDDEDENCFITCENCISKSFSIHSDSIFTMEEDDLDFCF
eukprot:gene5668-6544_t